MFNRLRNQASEDDREAAAVRERLQASMKNKEERARKLAQQRALEAQRAAEEAAAKEAARREEDERRAAEKARMMASKTKAERERLAKEEAIADQRRIALDVSVGRSKLIQSTTNIMFVLLSACSLSHQSHAVQCVAWPGMLLRWC
eukprot:m.251873 g.251873  ORF g.251873 m.251873 type:complete len:146 (+) comp19547_c0_seq4:1257-1694(+)